MLQALNLSMNKSTTNLSRVEVRDSDKGEILESFILNSDGTPYDLSGKSLVFNENKDGDKFVSDPNVTIVDARIGHITYQLHDQVHSARGTAWFDVIDKSNGAKIDSTTDFYIEVRDGLKCTVYNTTYISDLEKLKQQMEALIQQADGELKAELQKAEQQLSQELQNFRNQYNSLSNDFQNQFKSAQNARQADYNNQKDAINADWFNTKNNINKNALDTINAIKSNAKQVLDEDQANWNAKQTQWDSTFSAIVKEWQVKTNSLNATVQDLTNKFNTIIGQVSDLMNNKLPTINAKADAIQEKVNELRASLGQIDWTTFARRTDNSGGVNLLANTKDFSGFSSYKATDGANNGFTFDKKEEYSNDENHSMIRTKVAHVYGSNMKNAPLKFGQNVTLPAGTYTLSFLARHNGNRDEVRNLDLYSDWTDVHGGQSHGTSDDIHGVWEKHHITFTTSQDYTYSNLRLQYFTDDEIPGGSLYFANFKLEAGSIATDWCQSYLDFDRLDGRHDPIDAPDFNNLTSTGIYMIARPDSGQNYPIGSWGILKVENGHDLNIEQTYYTDRSDGATYQRQYRNGLWRPWKKVASIDDVNTRLPLSGGNMNKGSWITWNGTYAIGIQEGDIGGLQWNGATDYVKIFADNNQADNLDLAIQLGDDNSNHISIRDKDGAERATITADGQFTGRTNWANVMNTGIDNPTLGRYIRQSNTWNDIIGQDNGKMALAAFRDESNGSGNTIGNFSAGIVFGGGDTKGALNVAYNSPQARIIGGNGDKPVWSKDIAWKDDLNLKVVKSYDIERNQAAAPATMDIQDPWLVDQAALAAFADAHRDVRNHTDYRYPTDIASDTAINLNSDPYLDTGIYKIENCAIINGPWASVDTRRYLFLQVAKYDDNVIHQTINYGNGELYSRTVSKQNNSYPEWSKFATMNSITDLSDRLQSFTMQQAMFQHRVDYDSPSGTISDDTVDFNNYRETGILKVVNCLIQNGPYKTDNRHTIFLKVTNLDGQTQYQTVYEGDDLYGRKLYNGSGQWHKYTNTPI
ncbi:BppU family phage baseplate upper protein [Lactobacillus johnsonii]|uniref:BppU family phage baseplate upper protein n=1 Tax=Lactobacillus johnsonii TaxID=33959 RepID=UPI000B3A7771|nr:BppU family phage baseplate upper protein [Lactobacillus johnsonii]